MTAHTTYDDIADYLTDGYWEWRGEARRAFIVEPGGALTVNVTALTAEGQQLARWALEAWADVTGLRFRFVQDDNAQIIFDDDEQGTYTLSTVEDGVIISARINISEDWLIENGTSIDSRSLTSYIHEIGHALGLGHPGPYGDSASHRYDSIFEADSWQTTVMSPFDLSGDSDPSQPPYPVTPMIADIIAIQNLYGLPADSNAGDTVYGYHSNLDGYLGQFFALLTGDGNPFINSEGRIPPGSLSFADLDDDNDQDLIIDTNIYFENTGTSSSPSFVQRTGVDNPLENVYTESSLYGSPSTTFADLDGDGDLDLSLTLIHQRGRYYSYYFENIGSATHPDFMERTGDADPFDNVHEGHAMFADLDNDGDLDLALEYEHDPFLIYYKNIGTPLSPNFVQGIGQDDPLLGKVGTGTDIRLTRLEFLDLDDDGDLDIIAAPYATAWYIENTGTPAEPDFTKPTQSTGHIPGIKIYGGGGALAYADLDGDDDFDLAIADPPNLIYYFENTGTTTSHEFTGKNFGEQVTLTLYDSSGIDTLDLRTDWQNQNVDLRPGMTSYVYGQIGKLTISHDTIIENLIAGTGDDRVIGNEAANHLNGGAGNDALWGNEGDDSLVGGAGADRLDGGAGTDWLSYAGSTAGVSVRLYDGYAARGHAEGDTLSGFENLRGSAYADALAGNGRANRLEGGGGNDRMLGGSGDDILDGGPGADRLDGGAGSDRLNGGIGEDTASYAASDAGVVVRLHSMEARGGHAEGDTFTGIVTVDDTEVPDIEHLTGSSYNDVLAGDLRDNTLKGRAGNDTLYGGPDGGDDRMYGGNGDDRIFGGKGDDTISGDAGNDTLSGGPDDDTFVFATGDGDDIIRDFGNGSDKIDLSAFADIDSFDDLSMEQQGNEVVIDLSGQGGGNIVLSDFDIANLDASDFIF